MAKLKTDKDKYDCDPLNGNMYTFWAVGMKADDWFKTMGLWIVMVVQVIAPMAILVWAVYSLDFSNVSFGLRHWEYTYGSEQHGVSKLTSSLLQLGFLLCFTLHAWSEVVNDANEWLKIHRLVNFVFG